MSDQPLHKHRLQFGNHNQFVMEIAYDDKGYSELVLYDLRIHTEVPRLQLFGEDAIAEFAQKFAEAGRLIAEGQDD